jgi:Dihydrodipicolinate synthetase family
LVGTLEETGWSKTKTASAAASSSIAPRRSDTSGLKTETSLEPLSLFPASSNLTATVARLAELPRIIGLKDASGDVTRPSRLRSLVGPDFRLLSGDDALGLAFLAQGGDGCISVTSNVVPGLCRNMFLAWRQGPATRAQRLARPIAQLTAALFCETNPVALKYALSLFGLMSPRVRLPLVELSDQYKPGIAAILAELSDTCREAMIGRIGGPIRASRRAMVG